MEEELRKAWNSTPSPRARRESEYDGHRLHCDYNTRPYSPSCGTGDFVSTKSFVFRPAPRQVKPPTQDPGQLPRAVDEELGGVPVVELAERRVPPAVVAVINARVWQQPPV